MRIIEANPIAALSQNDFADFSEEVGGAILALKLRERSIIPETIPVGFINYISAKLSVSQGAFLAHLQAKPSLPSHQHFKADAKPSLPKQETFIAAIKGSYLSKEKEDFLLSL